MRITKNLQVKWHHDSQQLLNEEDEEDKDFLHESSIGKPGLT